MHDIVNQSIVFTSWVQQDYRPNARDCTWIIRDPNRENSTTTLIIEQLNINTAGQCSQDFIEVREGRVFFKYFVCFCRACLIHSTFKIQDLFTKIHAWANIAILTECQNLEWPLPRMECLSDGVRGMSWIKPFLSNINSQVSKYYLHV